MAFQIIENMEVLSHLVHDLRCPCVSPVGTVAACDTEESGETETSKNQKRVQKK